MLSVSTNADWRTQPIYFDKSLIPSFPIFLKLTVYLKFNVTAMNHPFYLKFNLTDFTFFKYICKMYTLADI